VIRFTSGARKRGGNREAELQKAMKSLPPGERGRKRVKYKFDVEQIGKGEKAKRTELTQSPPAQRRANGGKDHIDLRKKREDGGTKDSAELEKKRGRDVACGNVRQPRGQWGNNTRMLKFERRRLDTNGKGGRKMAQEDPPI